MSEVDVAALRDQIATWRAQNKPDLAPDALSNASDFVRFWSKVSIGDGCWDWMAYRDRWGYGTFYLKGMKRRAPRIAYEDVVGPIPPGLAIDHLCRNTSCVNPAHLEPVTIRVNTLRGEGLAARLAAQTSCWRGHPFDSTNTRMYGRSRACRACARINLQARRARLIAALDALGETSE